MTNQRSAVFRSDGDPETLLAVGEVAERLGVSTRTVWSLHSAGQIPTAVKVGSSTRWRQSEIERHIQGLPPAGR